MKKMRSIGLAAATLVLLNGCLLSSPYWNQVFEDRTEAIPLQAFTGNKTTAVKFECAKAFHGGLYPSSGAATWVVVANVNPQSQALLDSAGNAVYGAGKETTLPSSCWHLDTNSLWYSAIRATQNTTVLGTQQKYFHTFDKSGLECLGRENGKARHWLAWFGESCQSGAYYTIFRATS